MPCIAMTPSMPAPPDGRCGASSAAVRPLSAHDAHLHSAAVSTSVYTRFWKFLFHHWSATQPKTLDVAPAFPTMRRRRRASPSRLSASSEMRQRVDMLQELEAQPQHCQRGVRAAMQTTCANCRQRFFRAHGADAYQVKSADKTETSRGEFCSLDCRSSAQYRATVQHSIDHADGFGDTADSSLDLATSRL